MPLIVRGTTALFSRYCSYCKPYAMVMWRHPRRRVRGMHAYYVCCWGIFEGVWGVSQKTLGYCWRTYFHRDIAAIAALDSPGSCTFNNGICKAQFSVLGVRQQYPPVLCTLGLRQSAPRTKCNKTCSKNQCTDGWSAEVSGRRHESPRLPGLRVRRLPSRYTYCPTRDVLHAEVISIGGRMSPD